MQDLQANINAVSFSLITDYQEWNIHYNQTKEWTEIVICEITNAAILMRSFFFCKKPYTEGHTTGNKKQFYLSCFGHHPLNRCCFKGRAKFYVQYKSSTKKSSKQTTNKQTILCSTIPLNKIQYIHAIKNRTTCLEADRSAPCSQLDHILNDTNIFSLQTLISVI